MEAGRTRISDMLRETFAVFGEKAGANKESLGSEL